jgi:putative transposase
MARMHRLDLPGVPSHVILRGNDRQPIFHGDGDRLFLHRSLVDITRATGLQIHAYAMMTNHVHLLATAGGPGVLSRSIQSLGRRYVGYFNTRHQRTGTLWEGRFRSTLVGEERYLITCHRYIEQNPVRAGIVPVAADFRWSSHRCLAFGEPDDLVTPHAIVEALGGTPLARCTAYRSAFAEMLSAEELGRLRDAMNKGWAYGSTAFARTLEARGARRAAPLPVGRRKAKRDSGENESDPQFNLQLKMGV